MIKASQGKYTFSYKLVVPDNYPVEPVKTEEKSNSFPPEMRAYFRANAAEIARKCTQVRRGERVTLRGVEWAI